jgi:hypothetical protein
MAHETLKLSSISVHSHHRQPLVAARYRTEANPSISTRSTTEHALPRVAAVEGSARRRWSSASQLTTSTTQASGPVIGGNCCVKVGWLVHGAGFPLPPVPVREATRQAFLLLTWSRQTRGFRPKWQLPGSCVIPAGQGSGRRASKARACSLAYLCRQAHVALRPKRLEITSCGLPGWVLCRRRR